MNKYMILILYFISSIFTISCKSKEKSKYEAVNAEKSVLTLMLANYLDNHNMILPSNIDELFKFNYIHYSHVESGAVKPLKEWLYHIPQEINIARLSEDYIIMEKVTSNNTIAVIRVSELNECKFSQK